MQPRVVPGVQVLRLAAICITLALLAMRAVSYQELNRYLMEYQAAAAHVAPNTTLVSVSFASGGRNADGKRIAFPVLPFLHAAGHTAAEQGVVLINNYEGSLPYFPVQFRPQFEPSAYFTGQDLPGEQRIDLAGYATRTGSPIDYVLLWKPRSAEQGSPTFRNLIAELSENYRLVYQSPGSDHVRLYRHRSQS
jgi:hypothetical protein